ncbi:hypothetical protein [Cellulomonas sp. NTE-D12]|uniref:esterase/lipase family protein n=1 Tax=Cellulomonas sp. NTE-D12 TaxID=2962632 RepID=UPI003081DBCF|nr:hypothetical protein CELD12_15830 [Cellulomonas sp. NTE-D12]
MSAHIYSHISHPLQVHGLASTTTAKRLVVFLHGWWGDIIKSWGDFAVSPDYDQWWQEADLLFIGYDSTREDITAMAARLGRYIRDFYPTPAVNFTAARFSDPANSNVEYDELVLVGHSLGGLIIRRAVIDAADEWVNSTNCTGAPPVLLEAQLRLFSPASAGFRPAGRLALAYGPGIGPFVAMLLRTATAYSDLQPGSQVIANTRQRTERAVTEWHFESLRADLLWANPDRVVITERYDTDRHSHAADGKSHRSVCKPTLKYDLPYVFVEGGRAWS